MNFREMQQMLTDLNPNTFVSLVVSAAKKMPRDKKREVLKIFNKLALDSQLASLDKPTLNESLAAAYKPGEFGELLNPPSRGEKEK